MRNTLIVLALSLPGLIPGFAFSHGDVTPQAVDAGALPRLGKELRSKNPYRGNSEAVRIGSSAYNQNCARCHGLEVVSGGIAPDLRKMDLDAETDQYFLEVVRRGRTRDGRVYMPPFEGILTQEAVWAIRTYVETRREK